MKIVKEAIEFERGLEPKTAMGLGLKEKILKELEEIGISKNDIKMSNDLVISLNKSWYPGDFGSENKFMEIQFKYMPKEKATIAKAISKGSKDIVDTIDDAVKAGISKEEIKELIDLFIDKNDRQGAEIAFKKFERTKEDIKRDKENNIYVFIGFTDKVPVAVNGKQYYEDKFATETLVKLDKYNLGHLQSISAMKIRVQAQYGGNAKKGVYKMEVPKYVMDEETYTEIPKEWYQLFLDHMKKI